MSKRKSCKERNHSECESGWQAKFMNCKWDKAIGCHSGNNSPVVENNNSKKKHTPLKPTDVKGKKYGPDIDDCISSTSIVHADQIRQAGGVMQMGMNDKCN